VNESPQTHQPMSPDDYCQKKTASSGSSFYHSFRFLPPQKRRAITALYAFCREVDDVVDECGDPETARAGLNGWRQEVMRLFHGTPQHPVTRAIKPLLAEFDLAEEHFLEIIDGMEMDLERVHYENFAQLSLYCYRVASVVGLMAAEIFGYRDRHTLKYAHDLGMAFQLTNILRDVREDALRGRCYLPADEMARFGVSIEDITEGREHEGVKALLAYQAERAEGYYDKALAQLPEQDRYAQRSGLIMAEIYHALLRRIRNEGYPVLQRRVTLPLWRKLWLAWRCARREKKRAARFSRQGAVPS
jgi:phytoene synthase